ncbi:MAG: hypothetical protein Q9161_008998 [Pseudevernia consocians]
MHRTHFYKIRLAAMQDPFESTVDQYLTEQYLARIGYASGPEQQIPEPGPDPDPDPDPRPDIRLATIEEVQARILDQLKEQQAAQQQASSAISSRPATQTCRPDLLEQALSPSILPDPPSTAHTPGSKARCQSFDSSHEHKPTSPCPSPPPPLSKTETLAALQFELERRQKICLGIERQIKACQKRLRNHPSKQKKVEEEHDKQIAESLKPVHGEQSTRGVDAAKRKDAKTAEEAEVEEMRDIYLQYDGGLVGVPTAEAVDALFVVIASTEHHLKNAEEANQGAKRREAKLEEKLYKARCAVFEVEEEIEVVENGVMEQGAGELRVEKSRAEGHKKENGKGKGKLRSRKGVQSRPQGKGEAKGEGGHERVRRRRKRRRYISSKAGKMNSDCTLDS